MLGVNKSLTQDVSILFEIVQEITGITEEQIKNRSRKRYITDARMMMCESLRRNSIYTLNEIGSAVCNLDHSSIIHYRGKLNELCDVDKEFKRKFIEVDARFKQIKQCGLPLEKRLEISVRERDRLNKEIRGIKRRLKIYNNE
jgi:hypothetical protein